MRIVKMLVAAVLAVTPAVVWAQTTTPVLTVDAVLVDGSPGDGKIILSSKRSAAFPAKTAINADPCPITDLTPAYSYTKFGVACPTPTAVEPPVTTEPPVVVNPPVSGNEALARGEAFLQSNSLTVGFNYGGGVGTLYAAPAGFRTDTATGLLRAGFYSPPRDDAVLQGRAIEGFGIIVNGKRYANLVLARSIAEVPGAFITPSRWVGSIAGIGVVQTASVTDRLSLIATLTNTTAQPMTVRYFRSVDPDQSDLYSTTNTAFVDRVESKLLGVGGTFYMRALAGKATIATTSYSKPNEIGTTLQPGKVLKGDYVVQLVFDAVTIAPGATETVSMEMGIN